MSTAGADVERLYRDVLALEGIRHPFANPEGLTAALNYIESQLSEAGFAPVRSPFVLDGFDAPFVNLEAVHKGENSEEVLVTAHYDSRRDTPGADDNASAVAVLLETARAVAAQSPRTSIRFVAFTLEDGNPVAEQTRLLLGQKNGLLDNRNRFTSLGAKKAYRDLIGRSRTGARTAESAAGDPEGARRPGDGAANVRPLDAEPEGRHAEGRPNEGTDRVGSEVVIGSSRWLAARQESTVSAAGAEDASIRAVINLECVGFTSTARHSQRLRPGIEVERLPRHRVYGAAETGDFLSIVSDVNSASLGQSVLEACASDSIDLPALHVALLFDYESIRRALPDTLRSDHAPFWRAGIPAVMLTDTADFRNQYYHTMADTIETLDFEFMRRVSEAILAVARRF